MSGRLLGFAVVLAVLLTTRPVEGHFAWLSVDGDGHAVLFFGESIADRTYHLPAQLAGAAIQQWTNGTSQELPMGNVDSDSLVGQKSNTPVASEAALTCRKTYGIYQGSKLIYHAQHVPGPPAKWSQDKIVGMTLQSVLRSRDDGGVIVQVLHEGAPLVGAKVRLFCDDGHEEGAATTDDNGQVEFSGKQVEDGLNGLLVGHVDESTSGEFEGAKYSGEANYLTVTFSRE